MTLFADIGDNRRFITELRDQLASSVGVIPWVGAGFSVACGLPTWPELLRQIGAACGAIEQVNTYIGSGKFEEAAGFLEERLGPDSFDRELESRLSDRAVRRYAGPVLRVPLLTRGPVFTTNLDGVLETVFERSGDPFESLGLGPNVAAVRYAIHENRGVLVKIHGGLGDRATRVITLEEYKRAYGDERLEKIRQDLHLPALLAQIFTSRTLLFLGCSLTNDRTVRYLKWIAQRDAAPAHHFAVLSDPGSEKSRKSRAKSLAELNIRPIWYPCEAHERIHELLLDVLEPTFKPSFRPATRRLPAARLGKYLAIDFGTSFSVVAYASPATGKEEYCEMSSEHRGAHVPTVVRFLNEREYTIGNDCRGGSPRVLAEFRNFKRSLGCPDTFRVERRRYSAGEMAALFLAGLRQALEMQYKGPLPPALVSIPANFSTRQVKELTRALTRAGFQVMRLIGEPCAAGLNMRQHFRQDHDFAYMVVDIGGGTTDISIIERTFSESDGDFVFEIGCVVGDNRLGGVDFDAVLYELILSKLRGKVGERLALSRSQREYIETSAANMKITLGEHDSASIRVGELEVNRGELVNLEINITQQEFLAGCAPLLARIDALFDRALESYAEAGFNPAMIEVLMLAGQVSKLPPVRTLLERKRNVHVVRNFQDIAVARGLARQAAIIDAGCEFQLIRDVMYRAIYVAAREGMQVYRNYAEAFPAGNEERRVDAVGDVTGRRFLPLIDRYQSALTGCTNRIEFRYAVDEVIFETFEAGHDPNQPFEPREKWILKLAEPTFGMTVKVDVDVNRIVTLVFITRDTYFVSYGRTEAHMEKVACRYVSVPG